MPPEWTAAQVALYDQAMAEGGDQVDRLVLLLRIGAERKAGEDVRGERQAVADTLAFALRTFDKDTMARILMAAVLRISRVEEEKAARDGRVRFGLLDRVSHAEGPAVSGERTLSPDGTVVAVGEDEVGVLYDDAQDPARPATRYAAMHPRLAARYLLRTGARAQLLPADLALLDSLLPPGPAAQVRALSSAGPAPQHGPRRDLPGHPPEAGTS